MKKRQKQPKAIIPWMGGKSRLAKQIVELLPVHTCYCEVFAGGASVFFTKPRSKCEVINDVNGDLINLYRVVKYHERALIAEIRWQLNSREGFGIAIQKDVKGLTDIQRAARFLEVAKACFGGKGGCKGRNYGYMATSSVSFNRRIVSNLRLTHKRLSGVNIEQDSYDKIIERYDRPGTLFFCDPPYLDTASYQHGFKLADHQLLNKCLSGIKGKFILTVNNHSEIVKIYRKFNIIDSETIYSIGVDNKKKVGELIITNY